MVLFGFKALIQFLPQFLISAVVSIYFVFWVKQETSKILPSETLLINNQILPQPQEDYDKVSFTPLHLNKFKEDSLLYSIVTAIDSIILWILLLLSLSSYSKIVIFIPDMPFILRLVIYPVIGYFTLTSMYILSMPKIGFSRMHVFLSAVIVCFLILIFFIFPSMTWIFRINPLLRILLIYFALFAAVVIIYILQILRNSAFKNKIMLFSSILVYILIVSLILLKLLSHINWIQIESSTKMSTH